MNTPPNQSGFTTPLSIPAKCFLTGIAETICRCEMYKLYWETLVTVYE